MTSKRWLAVAVLCLVHASCTKAIGPTVGVGPAPGRPALLSGQDRRACMDQVDRVLQPAADQMNRSTGTLQQVAANNDRIQVLYDARYAQCMGALGYALPAAASQPPYARTDPMPGMLPSPDASADPASLQDADSAAAARSLGPFLRELHSACGDDTIAVAVHDAPVSPSIIARMVVLTTPDGVFCLGQPRESDFLLAKSGGGWVRLLTAEPGSIDVLRTSHGGHADLELHSLSLCIYRYAWKGGRYAQVKATDCATAAPPTMQSLPKVIRNR